MQNLLYICGIINNIFTMDQKIEILLADVKSVTMKDGRVIDLTMVTSEPLQPDYSHLVGKWVKCVFQDTVRGFTKDKWYHVEKLADDSEPLFLDDDGSANGFFKNDTKEMFDLTNPLDTNPDEVQRILVPSEVKIAHSRDVIGLVFGVRQFLVSPENYNQPYCVWTTDFCTPIQCELIKCDRKDLVKGDVAFRCSFADFRFDILENYCVIINDKKHCAIKNNDSVYSSDFEHEHWYKLQPLNN